jgi:hypothetical protein
VGCHGGHRIVVKQPRHTDIGQIGQAGRGIGGDEVDRIDGPEKPPLPAWTE